jgi:phage shock protein PspC (stress-responsive transcriptional regulator)
MEIMNEPRKLYRSTTNRMLGGVCAGIAEYLDTDPTVARVVAVLLFFLPLLPALLWYLIAWIIIPERA